MTATSSSTAGETATSGDLDGRRNLLGVAGHDPRLRRDGVHRRQVRRRSANTDGSGIITVTHGFEVIPAYVLLTYDTLHLPHASPSAPARATTFDVRVRTHDGSLMTGTATEFFWLAFTTT